MSGDTVTGRALQFTNDNKHAYAYSGSVSVGTTRLSLLEFETNSSYIVAKIQPTYFTVGTSENIFFEIYINNIVLYNVEITGSTVGTPFEEVEIIIPPNVEFKIEAYVASGTRDLGCVLTGKVGMAQRVGNLND